mgnify:CR=1 FL=1
MSPSSETDQFVAKRGSMPPFLSDVTSVYKQPIRVKTNPETTGSIPEAYQADTIVSGWAEALHAGVKDKQNMNKDKQTAKKIHLFICITLTIVLLIIYFLRQSLTADRTKNSLLYS